MKQGPKEMIPSLDIDRLRYKIGADFSPFKGRSMSKCLMIKKGLAHSETSGCSVWLKCKMSGFK